MFSTMTILDGKKRKNKKEPKEVGPAKLAKILSRYANWVTHHAKAILFVGLILMGFGFAAENKISTETDLMKMIPQNMTALKNTKYLQKEAGSTTYLTYLVKSDGKIDKSDIQTIQSFGASENSKYSGISDVTSIATLLKTAGVNPEKATQHEISKGIATLPSAASQTSYSDNKRYATIQFKIKKNLSTDKQLTLMNHINSDIKKANLGSVDISPAGAQVMQIVGSVNMAANHNLIMFVGLLIIFVVLLLVYRDIRLALMPVIPILIVLGLSPLVLYVFGISYNPLTMTLSSLVLGIGTEFTILILERYKEEFDSGMKTRDAVVRAVSSVGQAITVSALTVMGGFTAIIFVSFPALQSFGLITVLDTGFALISALTILPAIIYLLEKNKK
ncbi:efflux RND transporter permease subunit [Dellaglioa sp. L3N]